MNEAEVNDELVNLFHWANEIRARWALDWKLTEICSFNFMVLFIQNQLMFQKFENRVIFLLQKFFLWRRRNFIILNFDVYEISLICKFLYSSITISYFQELRFVSFFLGSVFSCCLKRDDTRDISRWKS